MNRLGRGVLLSKRGEEENDTVGHNSKRKSVYDRDSMSIETGMKKR
jgi:hypothetical protein